MVQFGMTNNKFKSSVKLIKKLYVTLNQDYVFQNKNWNQDCILQI